MSVEIKIRKGEPIERALRRLKKRLDREGVIRDVRSKRYFEKPSEVRRRKKKVAAFPPCCAPATRTSSLAESPFDPIPTGVTAGFFFA